MDGMVTLLQFDTEFFKVGQAVRVTWGAGRQSPKSNDCLIVSAKPESLEVYYWDPFLNEPQFEFILADHVVQQHLVIETLIPSHC